MLSEPNDKTVLITLKPYIKYKLFLVLHNKYCSEYSSIFSQILIIVSTYDMDGSNQKTTVSNIVPRH